MRWSIRSLPLPSGPGVAVSVDYIAPLPVTSRGNCCILLFTNRFSRRVICTPSLLRSLLLKTPLAFWSTSTYLFGGVWLASSDIALRICSKLPLAVYKLLGMRRIATSAYHPNGNGGVERVNRTMAKMLAMVVNERQDGWDVHLPLVEFCLRQFRRCRHQDSRQ